MKLPRMTRMTLVDQVVNAIEEKIINGDMKPGERLLGEIELSEQLGVARTTVREALRLLMGSGLITRGEDGLHVAPQLASVVKSRLAPLALVVRETRALYEARRFLEGELASLAALRASEEEITQLKMINGRLALESKDDRAYWELDMSFHQKIAEAAGNSVLYAMYRVARELHEKLEAEILQLSEIKANTHKHHAQMIAAIENRDPNAARKLVHDALKRVEAALLKAQALTSTGNKEGEGPGRGD